MIRGQFERQDSLKPERLRLSGEPVNLLHESSGVFCTQTPMNQQSEKPGTPSEHNLLANSLGQSPGSAK